MKTTIHEIINVTGLARGDIAKLFGCSRQNITHLEKSQSLPDSIKYKMLHGTTEQRAIWRLIKAFRKRVEIEPGYTKQCHICGKNAVYRYQEMRFKDARKAPFLLRLPQFLCAKHGDDKYNAEKSRTKINTRKITAFNNTLFRGKKPK
jgi:hypothetical protein